MAEFIPDYFIPEKYRGKQVELPCDSKDTNQIRIFLDVPSCANYLDVNPIEFEEEFQGFQGLTRDQQLIWYDKDKLPKGAQGFTDKIVTINLMDRLEMIFIKQY